MKRFAPVFTLFLLIIFSFPACQKEVSIENSNAGSDTTKLTNYGWEMKDDDTAYEGCIDTAYYANNGSATIFTVDMYDQDGNTVDLIVTSLSGSLVKGHYTLAQGASVSFTNTAGDLYTLAASGTSVNINLTIINDTLAEGNFSAELKNIFTTQTLHLKDGKFKAKIRFGKSVWW